MVFIDKRTKQRIVADPHSGDIQYESELQGRGNAAVDFETVEVIGPWTDIIEDGAESEVSGGEGTKQLMYGQVPNKFQGTLAGFEGAKQGNLNVVGQEESFTRRKRIIRTSEVKNQDF